LSYDKVSSFLQSKTSLREAHIVSRKEKNQ
jgi:hypothetical protein